MRQFVWMALFLLGLAQASFAQYKIRNQVSPDGHFRVDALANGDKLSIGFVRYFDSRNARPGRSEN